MARADARVDAHDVREVLYIRPLPELAVPVVRARSFEPDRVGIPLEPRGVDESAFRVGLDALLVRRKVARLPPLALQFAPREPDRETKGREPDTER